MDLFGSKSRSVLIIWIQIRILKKVWILSDPDLQHWDQPPFTRLQAQIGKAVLVTYRGERQRYSEEGSHSACIRWRGGGDVTYNNNSKKSMVFFFHFYFLGCLNICRQARIGFLINEGNQHYFMKAQQTKNTWINCK